MKEIRPSDYQVPLNLKHLILENQPETDETVPMDVLFVGAGPAGLAGAIELKKLIQKDTENGGDLGEIEVGVLEKAESLGGHNLSGAVINPMAFHELFPELSELEFPFKQKVIKDSVYFLTDTDSMRLPTPPTMHNTGNYIASICEVVRWMGEKAEDLGVNILTSFPADSLLTENGRVVGVRTTPAGLNRDGQPTDQYLPPTDIRASVTVLTEGTRGTLGQAYREWQKITSPSPQIYALGVKEVWKTKKPLQSVIHTMGWPLSQEDFGGSFFYPHSDNEVALGLVVGLDYKDHNMDVHKKLQELKEHPLFKEYLEGGELLEWGAKTIPEGGYYSLPEKLHGDGLLMAGDTVGFVNVPALKGIHYSMLSGIYAARTIFKSLKDKDHSSKTLKEYDTLLKESVVYKDLHEVRNIRQAFKSGFWVGSAKAGLMTLTKGHVMGGHCPLEEDSHEPKEIQPLSEEVKTGISKVDAVYLSGNKTRDDIPSHLTIGQDVSEEVAQLYSHLCPAGVYEVKEGKLVINAPNCIDCKATDVLGPRWQPREGGSGPHYQNM